MDNNEERKSKYNHETVHRRGGARPNAGRKRRMEEDEIIEKLQPMEHLAFAILKKKIAEGDMKAIQIFMNYFIGLPTQKIENKIEGNLNQVNVEVIKTNVSELEKSLN
jgi:hypothetical protein